MSSNAFIAAAVAGILGAATAQTANAQTKNEMKPESGSVPCYGINSCAGKSACMTKKNACAGQNKCKGQGFLNVKDKDACMKAGGSLTEKVTKDKK